MVDTSKVRVLVGLPTSDSKSFNIMVMSLIYQLEGFPVEFVTVERQRISTARNRVCWYMTGNICRSCNNPLKTKFSKCPRCGTENPDRGYTHLLFMDNDNTVDFRTLGKFIQYDKDMVTAIIRQRGEEQNTCIMQKRKEGELLTYTKIKMCDIVDKEIFKIDACGMGFCLIKRECVDKVIDQYGNPFIELCHKRQIGDYIEMAEIGEDLAFCLKATRLGFEIWADPSITTEHLDLPKVLKFEGRK